jgi:hypothetical protein
MLKSSTVTVISKALRIKGVWKAPIFVLFYFQSLLVFRVRLTTIGERNRTNNKQGNESPEHNAIASDASKATPILYSAG